jgi:hypothetical protein
MFLHGQWVEVKVFAAHPTPSPGEATPAKTLEVPQVDPTAYE